MHASIGLRGGHVQNQVGLVREHFFTPRLRFRSYDELNAWLLDCCTAHAQRAAHPELRDWTVQQVFERPTGLRSSPIAQRVVGDLLKAEIDEKQAAPSATR